MTTIEAIEARVHLSVTLMDGVLRVKDGDASDVIILRQGRKGLVVENNGRVRTFALADVRTVAVIGGEGNDRIDARKVKRPCSLFGNDGGDTLVGGNGRDTLDGGDGDDLMLGRGGNDFLDGGSGQDELDGGDGNDRLEGDDDEDTMRGGAGDDYFAAKDEAEDEIDGGPGRDRAKVDESILGVGEEDDVHTVEDTDD